MLAFDFYIENRQKIQMMYFYSNDLYRYARISSSPCDFLRCMMELCSDLISSSLSLPIKHLDYVTYMSSSLFLYYFSLNVHINQIFGRILKGNIAPQFLFQGPLVSREWFCKLLLESAKIQLLDLKTIF